MRDSTHTESNRTDGSEKRFRVALSFTGERRSYVKQVADILASCFGQDKILYDQYHEAEFARRDLGIRLPDLYHDESDLIVVIICSDYDKKDWTGGLEWPAIYDLLKRRQDDAVMPCRFERADVDGLYSSSGYMDLDQKSPWEAAAKILERLAINEGLERDHYTRLLTTAPAGESESSQDAARIHAAPAFAAQPEYLGSHEFVGRVSDLQDIDDWAHQANQEPVLLFEAMGGTGKSMLTWHWVTRHADRVREDWAGRYWYSFYERGAVMTEFARHAVAYIRGVAPKTLNQLKMPELADELLDHLRKRPYLFVLDGLERVLVAYNRYDAAQVSDHTMDTAEDQIADRDPCAAIRPQDDDFLRVLATAAPSKLLITTRLTPSSLLNPSKQAVPGVLRQTLKGLRPPDAERLLRSQGITGDTAAIRNYLTTNCDCHPLVTGVLAGLMNDYLPDPGNFDAWVNDSSRVGGARLDLAELDLKKRKNHILEMSIRTLKPESRQLLSTLALISAGVDYKTLEAFNPHLPPTPGEVTTVREAHRSLTDSVRDLERRGLLQYDGAQKRYDLHPVVRGVASGALDDDEVSRYGQHVVDHFNAVRHDPFEEAETWADVEPGIHVVRTLIRMGRSEAAVSAYSDVSRALLVNLECYHGVLSLLRPLFPEGWNAPDSPPDGVDIGAIAYDVGRSLTRLHLLDDAAAFNARELPYQLERRSPHRVLLSLGVLAEIMGELNRLRVCDRASECFIPLADADWIYGNRITARTARAEVLIELGRYQEAESILGECDDPKTLAGSNRDVPGILALARARLRFHTGALDSVALDDAESAARRGSSRLTMTELLELRGRWCMERQEWAEASEYFSEAVQRTRAVSKPSGWRETRLALATVRSGSCNDPRAEAERLSELDGIAHRPLSEIWLAVGDRDKAIEHAKRAYEWAWADGEPYVHRWELDRTADLLNRLGEPIPKLPPYDPSADEKFEWEEDLVEWIEELKQANETREDRE
ncbi:MAG: hypothetical protein AAGG07_02685 [Planctomycetota bacterium]